MIYGCLTYRSAYNMPYNKGSKIPSQNHERSGTKELVSGSFILSLILSKTPTVPSLIITPLTNQQHLLQSI
jgi:hypothetical protein